jgi:hypothetical protein
MMRRYCLLFIVLSFSVFTIGAQEELIPRRIQIIADEGTEESLLPSILYAPTDPACSTGGQRARRTNPTTASSSTPATAYPSVWRTGTVWSIRGISHRKLPRIPSPPPKLLMSWQKTGNRSRPGSSGCRPGTQSPADRIGIGSELRRAAHHALPSHPLASDIRPSNSAHRRQRRRQD